jgi:acylphosphatase
MGNALILTRLLVALDRNIRDAIRLDMAACAKRIVVSGRVQGVGFRYYVQHVGSRLGLCGDVRNCPDSTVEIVVEGDSGKMEEFIKKVKIGPSLARVERVDIADIPVKSVYSSFLIEGW